MGSVILKFDQNSVVPGLELNEWGTQLEMLDELDAIVNSGQSVVVLTILSDPNGVLVVSGGLFSGIESFVSLDVLDGLS